MRQESGDTLRRRKGEDSNKWLYMLKNGQGQIAVRVIILLIPLSVSAGWWLVKTAADQFSERVFDRFDKIDGRMDRMVEGLKATRGRVDALEIGQATTSAKLDAVKDRLNDRGRR